MIFIDSNIWCYYFNERANEHTEVFNYLEKLLAGKEEVVMNNLVVLEVAHFLVKNLGAIVGREKVEHLLTFPFVIDEFGYDDLLESVTLLSKYVQTGIGGRDAAILTTMGKLGVKRLVTHDRAFKKIDFIEVIDPVEQDT